MSVAIAGAGAVSAFGIGWRGLGRAVGAGMLHPSPCATLDGIAASEAAPLDPRHDVDPRARKTMSRAARLAAIAMREALQDGAFSEGRDEIGVFFGAGASGASMEDVPAILARSLREGRLDLGRLGEHGIAAVSPLFTFQTLNNFSMCHGAIAEGLGGPNAVFFSRGRATGLALEEALFAIESGECDRALAGGSDTALHPVTFAELRRQGIAVVPGEGAAVLALQRDAPHPIAFLEPCSPDERAPLTVTEGIARDGAVDVSRALGCALAAGPALALLVALDLVETDAVVLSRDVDGRRCAFHLWKPR